MANRLSYSQIEKYKFCGQAWKLHYLDRIRPVAIPSPLAFGNAIGKTFEHNLNNRLTVGFSEAVDFFDQHWTHFEWNGAIVNLKESKDVVYLKSDFDPELGDTPWESMRTKAHLMIAAFQDQFLPLVKTVHSTEEEVLLTSDDDSNIGFADAVVDLEGYDTPVVLDFKTAGRKYEENSVVESVQLSQYLYTLGDKYNTKLAGYVVFLKNIRKNRQKICGRCKFDGSGARFKTCNNLIIKAETVYNSLPALEGGHLSFKVGVPERCNGEWIEQIFPECDVQIIIDEIPITFQEKVIDNIGLVNDLINIGTIEPNYDGCDNDGFGKPCIYRDLCHGGKMDGLVKLEEKK